MGRGSLSSGPARFSFSPQSQCSFLLSRNLLAWETKNLDHQSLERLGVFCSPRKGSASPPRLRLHCRREMRPQKGIYPSYFWGTAVSLCKVQTYNQLHPPDVRNPRSSFTKSPTAGRRVQGRMRSRQRLHFLLELTTNFILSY